MLQTFFANNVAQAEEEVVGLVMPGGVECARFAHEVVDGGEEFRLEIDVLGGVAGDVEIVLGADFWSQGDLAKISAGDDGRINQLLHRNRRKCRFRARLAGNAERSS